MIKRAVYYVFNYLHGLLLTLEQPEYTFSINVTTGKQPLGILGIGLPRYTAAFRNCTNINFISVVKMLIPTEDVEISTTSDAICFGTDPPIQPNV